MTLDTTTVRSRRAVLAGALGGVAALAAHALGRPIGATAAEGDVVHVGEDLTGTGSTRITTIGDVGLTGKSSKVGGTGVFGDALERGVVGHATASSSSGAKGVHGLITGVQGAGVSGEATASTGTTVGVRGEAASNSGRGVVGMGTGEFGSVGVWGESTGEAGGIGVVARATGGGLALKVDGKVQFSRSGRTLMAKGKSSKKINLAVGNGSLVFAVLGSNRSGRYVRAVVPTAGSFTVYLNTTLQSDAWITWFVLN